MSGVTPEMLRAVRVLIERQPKQRVDGGEIMVVVCAGAVWRRVPACDFAVDEQGGFVVVHERNASQEYVFLPFSAIDGIAISAPSGFSPMVAP